MFKIYKNKSFSGEHKGWEFVKEFDSFDEARRYGSENICKDLFNEGSSARLYWVSDSGAENEGFKWVIDSVNYMK